MNDARNDRNFAGSHLRNASPPANVCTPPEGGADPLGFGAQPGSPVEVTLVSPVAGPASISESAAGTAPAGYQFLGRQVDITAPAASAASPRRADVSPLSAKPCRICSAR